jgi:hypothetical protein
MINSFKKLHKEFQQKFEPMYLYNIANPSEERMAEFFKATNKLRTNEIFIELESNIVSQMRSDLKTDKV